MTQSLLQKFSVTGIYSRNQKQKHSFHCKLPAVFLQISYLIFRTFSVYITTTSLQISATTPGTSSENFTFISEFAMIKAFFRAFPALFQG